MHRTAFVLAWISSAAVIALAGYLGGTGEPIGTNDGKTTSQCQQTTGDPQSERCDADDTTGKPGEIKNR